VPLDLPERAAPHRSRPALGKLRRRPKELTEDPTVFEPAGGGGGGEMAAISFERSARGGVRGPGATVFTDETAVLAPDGGEEAVVDPHVRAAARQIAARLSLPRPRRDSAAHRGSGELQSVPYRSGLDEIDLDRTLEVLAERPYPEDEDIIVRERVRTRRSVVLAIDVSGSMRGERLRTAAATVGALAGELSKDDLAVIAFWSDAAWLLHLGNPIRPQRLVDTLLKIPARGLTNVAFPLELAAHELQRAPARDARVVLLSDCVHNAGPDPRPLAARLPRLDLLLDVTGEQDLELGRELARMGRGSIRRIRSHRDVGPALNTAFAT